MTHNAFVDDISGQLNETESLVAVARLTPAKKYVNVIMIENWKFAKRKNYIETSELPKMTTYGEWLSFVLITHDNRAIEWVVLKQREN